MTSKIAKAAMAGAHTAGIFADMTVDGPVIGDLVVNIDRAKNLPNRKTMGKQNPYCAARLGKDAKKTPTDKRGGQTPKWDHELRFTVHDSPDYHQLKLSVFNDDKKTDLIGEAWLQLDDILTRGGGEREGWNSLNFKGRYAGEIWIELTYWDTRPREEKPPTPGESNPQSSVQQERSADGVSGPRQLQPKPVKRRPLPADPTSNGSSPARPPMPEQSQSSPIPFTPHRPQGRLHGPSPHSANEAGRVHSQPPPASVQHVEPMPVSVSQPLPMQHNEPPQRLPDELHLGLEQEAHEPTPNDRRATFEYDSRDDSRSSFGGHAAGEFTEEPEHLPEHYHQPHHNDLELPELPPHTPRHQRPYGTPKHYSPDDVNSSPLSYNLPDYGSSPEAFHFAQHDDGSAIRDERHGNPNQRESSFDEYSHNAIHPSIEDEGPPPPPPVHRSSGISSSPHGVPPQQRHIRHSVSASPLAQSHMELPEDDDFMPSPAASQLSTRSAPMVPYEPYNDRGYHGGELQRYQSYDHQPRNVGAHDETNHRMNQQPYRTSAGPAPSNYTPPHRGRHPPEHRYSVPPEDDEYWETRAQQTSAPLIKPRAISPSPLAAAPQTPQEQTYHRPLRKSVSPHPEPAPSYTPPASLSSIPFSPDSYDQLNPNLKNVKSINSLGPKYTTPEGAREAAKERAKEEILEQGPLRDHKGKIIDPSDHLPTDTWAPEPEKKAPRKSHQINIRFKNAPGLGAGAGGPRQPRASGGPGENIRPYQSSASASPAARETPPQQRELQRDSPRDHMQHAYTEPDSSPLSSTAGGGRNRLQKKGPHGYQQPYVSEPTSYHSSPILPTMHGNNAGGGGGGYTGSSPQYPLREHPNYGQGFGREAYQQRSGPPPVPAKIPLERGQEEWGMQRMNEEIRGIDIGVGSGGRRGGRGGARWRDI